MLILIDSGMSQYGVKGNALLLGRIMILYNISLSSHYHLKPCVGYHTSRILLESCPEDIFQNMAFIL